MSTAAQSQQRNREQNPGASLHEWMSLPWWLLVAFLLHAGGLAWLGPRSTLLGPLGKGTPKSVPARWRPACGKRSRPIAPR